MTTLRALECLVAVADCGSVTDAARQLHASQPAVSHQLAALEREAGTALLHRQPRGVVLTSAGRAALMHARRALEAAGAVVRSARSVGAGDGGELRVACAQSLTVSLLAPVIQRWHTERQHVAITLRESADAAELLAWLDDLTVDVVLMPGPVSERYVSTAVTEEEVVLTTPADHPLASVGTVRIEDLDGVALVHFAQDNGLSDWLDHVLARHGVRTKVVMRTSITSAVPQLAAAGFGVAVTPVSAVSAGLPASVRPFSPRWTRQLVAVTPSLADPLATQFVADLARRGVRPPDDVTRQLTRDRGGRTK